MLLRSDDGKEFILGPETLVGREEECQVVLNEEHVSRYHAKITVQNNKVSIEDLHSKNGTYINGKKLTELREIGIGDEICFDQMIFRVVTSDSGSAKSTLFRSPSKAEFAVGDTPKSKPAENTDEPLNLDLTNNINLVSNMKLDNVLDGPEKKVPTFDPIDDASVERIVSLVEAQENGFEKADLISEQKPSELKNESESDIEGHIFESELDVLLADSDANLSDQTFSGKKTSDKKQVDNSEQELEFSKSPLVSSEPDAETVTASSSVEEVMAEPRKSKLPPPELNSSKLNSAQDGLLDDKGPANQVNDIESLSDDANHDKTRFDMSHIRSRDQIAHSVDEKQVHDGAFLVVLSAPLRGYEHVLSNFSSSEVVAGRDDNCDIVISDSTVSSRHARFYQVGQRWCVANLGATNGVKVNGEKVDHAWLEQDDIVKLGRMEIQFSLKGTGPRTPDEIAASLFAKEKAKEKSNRLPWMVGVGFLSLIIVLFVALFFYRGF